MTNDTYPNIVSRNSIEMIPLKNSTSWSGLSTATSIGQSTLMSMLEHDLEDSLSESPSWGSLGMLLLRPSDDSIDSMARLRSDSITNLADLSDSALTASTDMTKAELAAILAPSPTPDTTFYVAKPRPHRAWNGEPYKAQRRPFSILAEMGHVVNAPVKEYEVPTPLNIALLPACLVPGRAARNTACTVDDLPSFDSLQVLSHLKPAPSMEQIKNPNGEIPIFMASAARGEAYGALLDAIGFSATSEVGTSASLSEIYQAYL
ncbi:hypothetical protein EXIGLDRAFT_839225 [Exidia glandulosa HHB12029]|uniref:Uncharacterized protein n=1 Tax=Exidia glandulosa HHB12029 TaxID=1314781 RepID=A0A165F5Z2_EXIGL|nr:hypothetical protein EXIGLDRAFT_839225 [Exidia glandulosa HHB12029]